MLAQAHLDLFGDLGGVEDPLVGGLGLIVAFRDLGTVPLLLDQHHDRLEEVEIQAQRLIEGIEGGTGRRALVAVVADHLAHGGPVLLLDVGLVVLVVGSTAGEGDLLLLAVALQVVVDELAAVVRVQAEQRIGQAAADRSEWRP